MTALFAAFGIKGSLLLAQAVNFAVVLVALSYFLYKPINKVLAERQQLVAKGVEDANSAAEKLAGADAIATARVGEADKEADTIVKDARATATAERAKMLADAEARAAQVGADAEARATEEAAKTRRESEKEIARLAILAAEKVMAK